MKISNETCIISVYQKISDNVDTCMFKSRDKLIPLYSLAYTFSFTFNLFTIKSNYLVEYLKSRVIKITRIE